MLNLDDHLFDKNGLNSHQEDSFTGYRFDYLSERSVVGNSQLRNNALTSGKIGTGAITGSLIANGAITNPKLGNASIGTANIGTLTFNQISGGTINNAPFNTGTINNSVIGTPAITGGTYTAPIIAGTPIFSVAAGSSALGTTGAFAIQTFAGSAILVVRSGGTTYYFTSAGTLA